MQMFVNRFSVLNLPLVNTPQQPYQPGIYQQGYDPNINQVNYQPGYIPTVQPNYQPPQYKIEIYLMLLLLMNNKCNISREMNRL